MEDIYNTLVIRLKQSGMENPYEYESLLKTAIADLQNTDRVKIPFVNEGIQEMFLFKTHVVDFGEECGFSEYVYEGKISDDILLFIKPLRKNLFEQITHFLFWRY